MIMHEYIVERTVIGRQTLTVKAKSKKEARRLVDQQDDSVEGMELEIHTYRAAGKVILGEK